MILTCPACNTRYLADSEGFEPNGRSVRCTNCEHTWFQEPPHDGPHSVEVEDVETEVVRSGWSAPAHAADDFERERSGKRGAWLIGLLVVIAVLGFILGGSYLLRHEIARAWPPAKGLFAVFGVEVATSHGLTFSNTSYSRVIEDGLPVLVVEGILINTTDEAQPFYPIRATLRDDQANELDAWNFTVGDGDLEAGGRQIFRTRRANPPHNAFELQLTIESEDGPSEALQ